MLNQSDPRQIDKWDIIRCLLYVFNVESAGTRFGEMSTLMRAILRKEVF